MQIERQEDTEEMADVERDDWNAKEIADESVNKPADETMREVLRGDESQGDPDERDVVGNPDSIDTPQGREEAKRDKNRNS